MKRRRGKLEAKFLNTTSNNNNNNNKMFSANENLILRKHKRRIVDRIEKMMPEEALDMGTTVMVMQVACKAPGCVPLETAVIIVFPKCGDNELIPGLPESIGGSYKTKILKPMADVTDDDILDSLPPAFEGGTRTMEKVCMYARDVMIGQITQLFGDDTNDESAVKDRTIMANFLQSCLQDYIASGCKPPIEGEPFLISNNNTNNKSVDDDGITEEEKKDESSSTDHSMNGVDDEIKDKKQQQQQQQPKVSIIPSTGNIVIRRMMDDDNGNSATVAATTTATTASKDNNNNNKSGGSGSTTSIRGQPPKHQRAIHQALNQSRSNISSLFDREHAPGIRKPGCPCCDPDDPSVVADNMMTMMM